MAMNENLYDDVRLERQITDRFAIKLDIAEVIARRVPTSATSEATVFKTANKQVFAYISAQSGQVLADVQDIIRRMQCEAEMFLPPHAEKEYFNRIGEAKFRAMFPGKRITGEDDLRYYRRLAPYNPALVRLSRIKGELHGYNIATKNWRKVKDFSYSRINPQ